MTVRRDARDDRPVRERRSKAGNAARLAEMAELSAPDERLEVMARGEDGLMHRVEPTAAEEVFGEIVAGCADALEECRAERERLRVIVDLACARYVAEEADLHSPVAWEWGKVVREYEAAVSAEVARRAAL